MTDDSSALGDAVERLLQFSSDADKEDQGKSIIDGIAREAAEVGLDIALKVVPATIETVGTLASGAVEAVGSMLGGLLDG